MDQGQFIVLSPGHQNRWRNGWNGPPDRMVGHGVTQGGASGSYLHIFTAILAATAQTSQPVSHLLVGDVDGSAEHDPLHHLAAGRRGQRARVAIVAPQRGREQILQDERLQNSLFLCAGDIRGQGQRSAFTVYSQTPGDFLQL